MKAPRPFRQTCDAEVGRPGGVWHRCGRGPIVIESQRRLMRSGYCYSLWYCRRHWRRANVALRGSIEVLRVNTITPNPRYTVGGRRTFLSLTGAERYAAALFKSSGIVASIEEVKR